MKTSREKKMPLLITPPYIGNIRLSKKTPLVITPPYFGGNTKLLQKLAVKENQSVVRMKKTNQEPQFRDKFQTF